MWRLAVRFNLPGDRQCSEGLDCRETLGDESVPLDDSFSVNRLLEHVHLAVRAVSPGGVCNVGIFEVLCAWRYASSARWSGSGQRLAPCE